MTENERVKAVRKALSLTQEAFGNSLGVTKSTVSAVEKGVNSVSSQLHLAICREFGVDETWLRTGEGEMFVQRGRDSEIESFVEQLLREETESFRRSVITALSRLSVAEWDAFAHFLKEMDAIRQGEAPAPQPDPAPEAEPKRPLTDEELWAEVEAYKRELFMEREAEERSSASKGPGSKPASA